MPEYPLKSSFLELNHNVMVINSQSFKLSSLVPPVRLYRSGSTGNTKNNTNNTSDANSPSNGTASTAIQTKGPLPPGTKPSKRRMKAQATLKGSIEAQQDEEENRLREEESQPWRLEDSEDRTFVGRMEGSQSGHNGNCYVLLFNQDNNFHVVPINRWYKFQPKVVMLEQQQQQGQQTNAHNKETSMLSQRVKSDMHDDDESMEMPRLSANEMNSSSSAAAAAGTSLGALERAEARMQARMLAQQQDILWLQSKDDRAMAQLGHHSNRPGSALSKGQHNSDPSLDPFAAAAALAASNGVTGKKPAKRHHNHGHRVRNREHLDELDFNEAFDDDDGDGLDVHAAGHSDDYDEEAVAAAAGISLDEDLVLERHARRVKLDAYGQKLNKLLRRADFLTTSKHQADDDEEEDEEEEQKENEQTEPDRMEISSMTEQTDQSKQDANTKASTLHQPSLAGTKRTASQADSQSTTSVSSAGSFSSANAKPEKRQKVSTQTGQSATSSAATNVDSKNDYKTAHSSSFPASPISSSSNASSSLAITEEELINALKDGPVATQALLLRYKKRVKDYPENRNILALILRRIATVKEDTSGANATSSKILVLKPEYHPSNAKP